MSKVWSRGEWLSRVKRECPSFYNLVICQASTVDYSFAHDRRRQIQVRFLSSVALEAFKTGVPMLRRRGLITDETVYVEYVQ